MVGGNHDRWGGDFWERDLGVRFDPHRLTFEIGRPAVAAIHGDGLTRDRAGAPGSSTGLINHPATSAVYRTLHPELGLRLVGPAEPASGRPDATRRASRRPRSRQQRLGRAQLVAREPELGLVIMGHTHRPAAVAHRRRRHLPQSRVPGSTAVATRWRPRIGRGAPASFTPAAPPPRAPAARR